MGEWETRLAKPWMDLVVGGTLALGRSTALSQSLDESLLLYLSSAKTESPIEKLRPAMLESTR